MPSQPWGAAMRGGDWEEAARQAFSEWVRLGNDPGSCEAAWVWAACRCGQRPVTHAIAAAADAAHTAAPNPQY